MDEETGDYNKSYIKKYLNSLDYAIIKFVKRSQGLMVKKGNPLSIQSVKDLTRPDIQFVNSEEFISKIVKLDGYSTDNIGDIVYI
ncbi:substrate-binding domain-containing protein [Alkaliphilus sp. B6464]|uniref:substrate-binding domain-containing protein n=1 Tax=Alkaliphilus sp. B6464 TaxID=2731219 RepID=UPI002012E2E0|nr:substrate-binding domain-containing protein [Alkaliphilus sp. B6464]